jgi:hypothetical protein
MKELYRPRDLPEAHILRGLLESAGIEAYVQGESLVPLRGVLPFADAGPSVWVVVDEDLERARELVEEYRAKAEDPVDHSPWTCSGCGEELEPQFTECWNCGASRVGPYR